MATARILVIDDDQHILEMLRLALSRSGFEVIQAIDGDIGLRRFQEDKPDLAIIDIAMPGIDGYQVIERIRDSETGNKEKMPIIVLTAHDQGVMKTYAEELGVELYLTKPIAPKVLADHISKLLDK